jgi:REP element-mobilizing transposase RayT
MRTTQFAVGEMYHVYNRGVDKRSLFTEKSDLMWFLFGMRAFNQIELTVALKREVFAPPSSPPLVRVHAYCVNQNHYHMLLEPLVDDGVQKFMHRLGTSYTNYFNKKYDRNGSLFQGPYKAIHITTDAYMRHLSAYVSFNFLVHAGMNKQWFAETAHSSISDYKKSTDALGITYQDFVSELYGSTKQFLSEGRRTALRVERLRTEIKEYQTLCLEK